MFIQTEATPNPATLKFIPGRTVLDTGTMEFSSREAASRSPLAERLFSVPGVTSVFYGSDFVTVTKDDSDWQHLKPAILGAIMEHYMSGAPLLADGSAGSDAAADEEDEFFNEADADTVATIKDLIETRVRPAVASDGGEAGDSVGANEVIDFAAFDIGGAVVAATKTSVSGAGPRLGDAGRKVLRIGAKIQSSGGVAPNLPGGL